MKKTRLVLALVALASAVAVCAAGIVGYLFLDSLLPKAKPLELPETDAVVSASVSKQSGETVVLDSVGLSEVAEFISASRPTRKMSVNDYPTAEEYYTVTVASVQREYRFFVYEENRFVYVELPYEGIYRSDSRFLDVLSSYLNKKTNSSVGS